MGFSICNGHVPSYRLINNDSAVSYDAVSVAITTNNAGSRSLVLELLSYQMLSLVPSYRYVTSHTHTHTHPLSLSLFPTIAIE